MMTYGDGVSNVELRKVLDFHRSHGRLATVTVVRPPARFGSLEFDGDLVTRFVEKPQLGEGWINGGFFVLEPGVFDYLRRRHAVRTSAAGAARGGRPADGVSARRLLAEHGHAARQAVAGVVVGRTGSRSVADMAVTEIAGETMNVRVLVTGSEGYIGSGDGAGASGQRS